jgi:DNA-binding CsgD family transcriptional regulator/tetratricopeptide (TPR) repeat protein
MSVINLYDRVRRAMVLAAGAADTWDMTLLERESALGSLTGFAGEAQRGNGQFVLVVGEAGVGKSALIEQFERDLPEARWLWGACDGLFTPRPLAPLFDIAEELGGELLDRCRDNADREELFRALLRQLSDTDKLSVVVVEDIHWADEATLDLLRFIARRIRNTPVLLIATYRDEALAAGGPLRRGLGELVRPDLSSRIELAPLSRDAVGTMTGPSELLADDLYQLTGGNPFYVTEVLRTGTGEIPATTRDVILARAARLNQESRETLDAAALIGARVEVAVLDSVTGTSPAAIDELLASGLLVSDGAHLRFRHEIARLAIEQAIPAHRRGDIHRRVLVALHTTGCEDEARLAFHAEGAADAAAVLRYAPRAARRAVELASHSEAVAQYQRTLRFAASLESARVAEMYDLLITELSLVDRWQEAAEAGEHALALWRAVGDRLREGDAMRRQARTLWRLCRGREANAAAEAALAILEPLGPSTELARAYASVASTRMVNYVHDEAIRLARHAQAIAAPLDALDVLSDALNTEGCAAFSIGDDDWTGPLTRALDIAISNGLDEQAGRAFTNLFGMHIAQLEFAAANRYLESGIAFCDEHDISTYATCLRGGKSGALVQLGQWDEAEALSQQLLVTCGPSSINRIAPLQSLATMHARRGEPDALELLDRLMAATEGTGEPQYVIPARLARAEAYWLQGNTELARRETELADDIAADCDGFELGAIATWLRRTGSTRLHSAQVKGPYLAQLEGDWRRAADEWTRAGCAYNGALALVDANEEAPLREALQTFENLGASAAARLTRQRMRAIGIRSIPAGRRASTRAHPLGLTQREREVLDLVCDGYTNAEIAAELVISPRTADHHVSAILAKLGASSRTDAATEAARLGLYVAS